MDVMIKKPTTIDEAVVFARAYEQRLALEPARCQGGHEPFRPPGQVAAPPVLAGFNPTVLAKPPGADHLAALP